MRFVLVLCLTVMGGGCMKRAPTNYELDRRSGMPTPPPEAVLESEKKRKGARWVEPLRSSSVLPPAPVMPARVAPVVRKVWVPDQLLEDGSWVQGTWMFVEVEAAHWLPEVEPGGAEFVAPTEGE